MKEGQLEGSYKTVKCPKCDSENVEPVHPFDYVKQCQDCGEQFSTGIHN
jgi:ribosomal protein S27E